MWFYRSLGPIVKAVFWILCDLRILGRENIPPKDPLIVVANHQSWLDIILLGMVLLPRTTSFMAKEELFLPLWGWLLRRLGAFPVSRSRIDRNALKVASEMLHSGWALGIFPEGTRRRGGELERTFAGAAFIAFHCQAHILPVGIRGIKEIRPFHRPQVRVDIGPPFTISPDGNLTHSELARLNEELKAKIVSF